MEYSFYYTPPAPNEVKKIVQLYHIQRQHTGTIN